MPDSEVGISHLESFSFGTYN